MPAYTELGTEIMHSCRECRKNSDSICCCNSDVSTDTIYSLEELIKHYIDVHRPWKMMERKVYGSVRISIDTVVKYALSCRCIHGRVHPHQWRIRKTALKQYTTAVCNLRCGEESTFYELFSKLRNVAQTVSGIGPLTTYDIAWRIGARLGLAPQKVYLHAGARKGAIALQLNVRDHTIPRSELVQEYPPLAQLDCAEIEDFLCIYKEMLRRSLDLKD